MTREQHDRLAAEHVLGLLDGDEQSLAERLLGTDGAFREAVERWRAHFAEFDDTAVPLATPPALWDRIESAIARARDRGAKSASSAAGQGLSRRCGKA